MASVNAILVLLTFGFLHHQVAITDARLDVGVCYGLKGDNLPPPADVIELYKSKQIGKMRLFEPYPEVLAALGGSGIELMFGAKNEDLQSIASSVDAAKTWFDTYVKPFVSNVDITYLSAGNEIIPGDFAQFVTPAMQNLQSVVNSYGLSNIRVTTVVHGTVLTNYPPSSSVFTDVALPYMKGILNFLSSNGTPLMVNVYPYYAYISDPANVGLAFAQFTATGTVVQDGPLSYSNLFDAILDSYYWAIEKTGVTNVDLVVAESGWPSAGYQNFSTPELAQTYNQNLVKRFLANTGTPKRPDVSVGGFIFAMFNENQKPAGTEQNFGLFYPSKEPVYDISFK